MHLASILSLCVLDGIALDQAMEQVEPVVWDLTSLQPEAIEKILENIPQKIHEIVDVVLSPRISTKQSQP
jgi:glycerol-3-phosphate responsive antiterminator